MGHEPFHCRLVDGDRMSILLMALLCLALGVAVRAMYRSDMRRNDRLTPEERDDEARFWWW